MTTLSQKVADHINATSQADAWPTQAEAVRRTFAIRPIESIMLATISVFDGPRASSMVTRGQWIHTKSIFVVVQKKIDAESPESTDVVDELVDLLELIETAFEDLAAGSLSPWDFTGFDESSDRLPFSATLLQDDSVFAAIVGLEFED